VLRSKCEFIVACKGSNKNNSFTCLVAKKYIDTEIRVRAGFRLWGFLNWALEVAKQSKLIRSKEEAR
jgi:hypothetical protein